MDEVRALVRTAGSLAAACAGLPGWVYAAGIFAYAGIYICRIVLVYRFAVGALDKAHAAHIPDLMNAVSGHTANRTGKPPGRRRQAASPPP
ncbi:hypothetical protein PO587_39115 [Streptomyces gilvifuscus]|uniref:Uncharacterized protein n=1 Tax=Streptomyces gilvifuscus TaxID=1550617 RepID=A0ABT5G6G5_9ACTN|nr:hypothetical protein [Streptomyces gilvifuscus]MDC2960450.1 hypothetical protein [Streptomyces gilvifuscus]